MKLFYAKHDTFNSSISGKNSSKRLQLKFHFRARCNESRLFRVSFVMKILYGTRDSTKVLKTMLNLIVQPEQSNPQL